DAPHSLTIDKHGLLSLGENVRGQVLADHSPTIENDVITWIWTLAPGQSKSVILKVPYTVLTGKTENDALTHLDFEKERAAMAEYWRRRMDERTQLICPEPVLTDFFRADATHLLINCELEPNSSRRFARV